VITQPRPIKDIQAAQLMFQSGVAGSHQGATGIDSWKTALWATTNSTLCHRSTLGSRLTFRQKGGTGARLAARVVDTWRITEPPAKLRREKSVVAKTAGVGDVTNALASLQVRTALQ